MRTDVNVAAIVLAAGLGSRFGDALKPLAPFRGEAMVRHVCRAALASKARPVLVVIGHRGAEVAGALEGLDVRLVESPDYAQGLSRSLQAGFAALPADASGALILLADMPLVEATTLDALIAAFARAPVAPAVVPVHEGRRGNPALLSRALTPEIMRLTGDHGAGGLLRGRAGVVEVEAGSGGIFVDADTPGDLAGLG
ncbi:MAG: nucleotidyltransferase family protein [Salinarimonadaceae bacterium]|nr:MAG: nucleotidyltransferase family protein [Salinarimonadaceae bacterium]